MLSGLAERLFTQRAFYASLFLFFFASVALLVLHALGAATVWSTFYRVYLVLALAHTWYVFVLLARSDLRPRTYPRYAGEAITVVIPCYNEDPELLERAVHSVVRARGVKHIVVVDDGSTNGVHETLRLLAASRRVRLHVLERNQGKRAALHAAITRYVRESPFVVVMDSDTILDEAALVRVVEPLKAPKIGAASADVRILNEDTNLLTRMAGAYYWVALHIQRRAQSALGMVGCCSGALAAYRSEVILAVIDDFVTEEFFGQRCTYSDDRHLTNLVLKQGYDVVFVPEAVAHTYTPETYRVFMRQQIRWRRGFFQEAIFGLTFLWRVKPLLFIEMLLWDIALTFLSFAIVLLVLFNAFTDPVFLLFGLLPSLALLMFVRHMPLFFYAPRKILPLFCFTLFSHFVMYWQSIYAIFTLRRGSWNTR